MICKYRTHELQLFEHKVCSFPELMERVFLSVHFVQLKILELSCNNTHNQFYRLIPVKKIMRPKT